LPSSYISAQNCFERLALRNCNHIVCVDLTVAYSAGKVPCPLEVNDKGAEGGGQLRKHKQVKQSRYMPWRRLGGLEYSSYSFTTSVLDGGKWSASLPGRT
jgi:hypothetical protein